MLYTWFVNAMVVLAIAYLARSFFIEVGKRSSDGGSGDPPKIVSRRKKRSKDSKTKERAKQKENCGKGADAQSAPAPAASIATAADGSTSESSQSSSEISDSPDVPVRGVEGWSRVSAEDCDPAGNFWEDCLWQDASRRKVPRAAGAAEHADPRGGSSHDHTDWVDVGATRDRRSGACAVAHVSADGLTKKQRENRRRNAAKSEKQALIRSLKQY